MSDIINPTDAINPTNGLPSSWTDERVALLCKLHANGDSASLIAAELGGVTRNAVIGKCHRLGLLSRASIRTLPHGNYRATSFTLPTSRMRANRDRSLTQTINQKRQRKVPPMELPEVYIIPPEQRCSLLELSRHTCRFPIGEPSEPDFYFCGSPEADITEDRPYCHFHMRTAYGPRRQYVEQRPFHPYRGQRA